MEAAAASTNAEDSKRSGSSGSELDLLKGLSRDDAELTAMGYKAQLRRGFNGLMSFAFCFTAVAVLSSISISMGTCLLYTGGPVVMVWGWLITSFFTILVGASMGEVCSTYPSAGSVYHWAGQLSSEAWAPGVAFITGWFNFMGNVAGDAAFAYGFANFVTAAQHIRKCPVSIPAVYAHAWACGVMSTSSSSSDSTSAGNLTCTGLFLNSTGFSNADLSNSSCPSTYGVGTQVGIAIAVCACWAALNILRVDAQGWLNNGAMGYQIATTVAIVAEMLSKAGQNHDYLTSGTVWEYWRNKTGLTENTGRDGYVLLLGLTVSCYCFSGYEAGAHMAEETRNASRSSALGLLATVTISAVTGMLYILGLIYSIPNSVGVYTSLSIYGGAPIASLFSTVTGNKVGLMLTNIIIANLFFAGISSFTVTTRVAFAMARDDAFPGSQTLKLVHPSSQTPLYTVALVFIIDCLLLLLPLATMKLKASYGPVAFNAVTSICVIGYQMSYCVPLMLRGTTARKTFLQTDFNLGRFGTLVANIAWFWLFVTSLFLFWPTTFPVDKYVMNYTVVVVFGFGFVAAMYWFVGGARKTFVGPKRVNAAVFRDIAARTMRLARERELAGSEAELGELSPGDKERKETTDDGWEEEKEAA